MLDIDRCDRVYVERCSVSMNLCLGSDGLRVARYEDQFVDGFVLGSVGGSTTFRGERNMYYGMLTERLLYLFHFDSNLRVIYNLSQYVTFGSRQHRITCVLNLTFPTSLTILTMCQN